MLALFRSGFLIASFRINTRATPLHSQGLGRITVHEHFLDVVVQQHLLPQNLLPQTWLIYPVQQQQCDAALSSSFPRLFLTETGPALLLPPNILCLGCVLLHVYSLVIER